MSIFDPNNMERLDREERKAMFSAKEIWREAGLRPGMTAADIGCGSGFFTFDAAASAGNGIVYALDLQQPMIDELQKRIEANEIKNIRPVITGEYSFILPGGIIDIALMAFVLHEVEDKLRFLGEALRILKQNGKLCVLDKKRGEKGPHENQRISADEVNELLFQAGFKDITSIDYNPGTYLISGTKK